MQDFALYVEPVENAATPETEACRKQVDEQGPS